jgi:hypothetical protein
LSLPNVDSQRPRVPAFLNRSLHFARIIFGQVGGAEPPLFVEYHERIMAKKVKFEDCRVCKARFTGKEEMSQLGRHILTKHPDVAWKVYAEIYLDKMWFGHSELDKRFVKEFESIITFEKLANLFGKYSLSRNFVNGVCGYGSARFQRFADMLNRYRDKEITKEEFPNIVEKELKNMCGAYNFEPLSAITKSFWMMKQHPIVIYDSYAWKGLQRRAERLGRRDLEPGGSYRSYYTVWFNFFEDSETKDGLKEALEWLPDSPAAKKIVEKAKLVTEERGQAVIKEIKELAAKDLMRNRVLDMRLLYEGGWFLEDSLSCPSKAA